MQCCFHLSHTTFMKKRIGDNLGIHDTRLSVSEKVSLFGSVLIYMTLFVIARHLVVTVDIHLFLFCCPSVVIYIFCNQ